MAVQDLDKEDAPIGYKLKYPHFFFVCAKKQTKTAPSQVLSGTKNYTNKIPTNMGYNENQNMRYLDKTIENLIRDYLSEGEECKIDGKAFTNEGKTQVHPDILLPNGCKKLGIRRKSIIEVRFSVRFDTIRDFYYRYNDIKDENGENYDIVLVYFSNARVLFPRMIEDEHFKIITAEDFFARQPERYEEIKLKIYKNDLLPNTSKFKNYKDAFNDGNCTLFIGSGVSMDAGLPSWDRLLFKMAKGVNPQIPFTSKDKRFFQKVLKNSSMVEARYLKAQLDKQLTTISVEGLYRKQLEDKYKEIVKHALYPSKRKKSKLIESIANIAIYKSKVRRIITYNFDDLLENAIAEKKIIDTQAIYDRNSRVKEDCLPILYVHGIIPQCDKLKGIEIVLSEDDYHNLYNQPYSWANVEQAHALQSSTCFFIGMSMSDPDLRRLLEVTKTSDEAKHYAFLLKSEFFKNTSPYPEEHVVDKMFLDLGVQVVWYNEYEELPSIIDGLVE